MPQTKPRVLVTRRLPEEPMRLLEENFALSVNPHDRAMTRQELLAAAPGQDGLLPLLADRIDGEVLDAAGRQLRIVANYAVGYNNIDVPACTQRMVAVTNTPDVLTDATADLAMALLLAVARRIVEGDGMVRADQFPHWGPTSFLGADLNQRTLGILGMGRIGQATARRALGFGLKIIYHNRASLDPAAESSLNARYVDLPALLAESDYLSIHVPLTPETHHLIGAAELAAMKPTAFIINTSRGPVIDEAALAQALQQNQIAGAGLDVYENEPQVHPDLPKLPNTVLAPHVGSATLHTRTQMGLKAAQNLIALLINGDVPPNCLNEEVLG